LPDFDSYRSKVEQKQKLENYLTTKSSLFFSTKELKNL